jgi:integrase
MSLYRRKDSPTWWVDISHKGKRIQQSSGTSDKAKAQEYHDKLKSTLWEQERLGVKPSHFWQDAVVRYVNETTHKATHDIDKGHLRWLDTFLRDRILSEVNRDLLEKVIAAKLKTGVKPATVNRVLEVVRAILRKAVNEWEWIDRVPSFRFLREPTRRVRFLTRDEAERLLAALPSHLAAMTRFSLETGLRRANVTGLEWSQVDLVRRCAWIHPDQAKARKAIAVPLTAAAVVLIREQIGKHETHVFSFRGKRITQVNTTTWRKALKRVGIEDFRWHDLRHTWASWHVQSGTPLHALQELGGWETADMVRRYAHLTSEHLAPYVERFSPLRVVRQDGTVTNPLRASKEQEPALRKLLI